MKHDSRRPAFALLALLAALFLSATFLVGPATAEPGTTSTTTPDTSAASEENPAPTETTGSPDGSTPGTTTPGTTTPGTTTTDEEPPSIPAGQSLMDVVAVDVQSGAAVPDVMFSLNGSGSHVAPAQLLVSPGPVEVAPVFPLPVGYVITSGSYPSGEALEQQVLPLTILIEKAGTPPAPRDPDGRTPIRSIPSGRTH